jgi:hypothetical protein
MAEDFFQRQSRLGREAQSASGQTVTHDTSNTLVTNKSGGKKASPTPSDVLLDGGKKSILFFPSNIQKFPTFMEYTAYSFVTKGGQISSTDSAFGNVGAVEKALSTIYLPSLKSSVTETQSWGMEGAQNEAAAGAGEILAGMKGKSGAGKLLGGGIGALKGTFAAGGKAMDKKAMAAAAIVATGQGFGVMEQQALKYDGPEQRTLSCTYTFIPRSGDETNAVHDIIKAFRYYSAPTKSNIGSAINMDIGDSLSSGSRSYKFPSLFKIRWVTGGDEVADVEWLPKFDTCYCDSVAVEYGDEKFTTFHGTSGAPTTYTLTLSFKELEYPTKGRIKGGF